MNISKRKGLLITRMLSALIIESELRLPITMRKTSIRMTTGLNSNIHLTTSTPPTTSFYNQKIRYRIASQPTTCRSLFLTNYLLLFGQLLNQLQYFLGSKRLRFIDDIIVVLHFIIKMGLSALE